ncbi:uncharacterized protein LOC111830621 [Capsella rubella]|uniref:uncharacterized protein LOC111830621 n=1 Tax=Capsella rubella TaxID=81985 RepID=UPI000CD54880|nr:uncharacterized protein LOC111830621 [Capsella rubella]
MNYFRSWLDKERFYPNGMLTRDYAAGLTEFMHVAMNQERCLRSGMMFCPCPCCNNTKFIDKDLVWSHIYRDGIMSSYKTWFYHGEKDAFDVGSSSGNAAERVEEYMIREEEVGTTQMVHDAYRENMNAYSKLENAVEEPNVEAKKFCDMLDSSKSKLYEGCKEGHFPLFAATRMMNIKTDYNLPEDCVDAWADFIKEILPEDNISPASYTEFEKLVAGLGLPYQMIDVCIDNCMIYWQSDANYIACRFCGKPRFQNTGGRSRVPFKRMWYLPIADRLKRLYQQPRTAGAMRWHHEHSNPEGQIAHPS